MSRSNAAETLPKLLIVEDDEGLTRQYRWAFPEYQLLLAHNRADAIALFAEERPPVAVLDLGLPPDEDGSTEGFATLEEIMQLAPETKIVVATGNDTLENALRAVRLGAYDFYRKPVEIEALRFICARAHSLAALEQENRRLSQISRSSPIDGIIAGSPEMLKVCRTIEKVASTDVAVLILGESGTGKELLAHAIHALSPRAAKPFIAINCAAIPETLLESELFGYERGAFTGAVKQTIGKIESAHQGTLFLDEIGDVPLSLQVKLLRFLQDFVVERLGGRQQIRVNVRIVCATNQDLEARIGQGVFREDLFYRINELAIRVPPLRERVGDVPLLANFFLQKYNAQFKRNLKGFSPAALVALTRHEWRGNVRELENRLKRAVAMADDRFVTEADLDLAPTSESDIPSFDLRKARADAERRVVELALAHANRNVSQAAKLLGVSRPTLYDLLEENGIKL